MPYNAEWGAAMREAVAARFGEKSERQLARLVGMSAPYLGDILKNDRVPGINLARKLAEATAPKDATPAQVAEHVNRLLAIAHHAPAPLPAPDAADHWDPQSAFVRACRELAATHRAPLIIHPRDWPDPQWTAEQVQAAIRAIEVRSAIAP